MKNRIHLTESASQRGKPYHGVQAVQGVPNAQWSKLYGLYAQSELAPMPPGAMGNNPSAEGQYRMQSIHKRLRSGRWLTLTD